MDLVVPVESEDAIARSRQIESGAVIREGGFQARFVDRGDGDDVRKPRRIIQGPGARVSGRGDDHSPPPPRVPPRPLAARLPPPPLVPAPRAPAYLRTVLRVPAASLGAAHRPPPPAHPPPPDRHH